MNEQQQQAETDQEICRAIFVRQVKSFPAHPDGELAVGHVLRNFHINTAHFEATGPMLIPEAVVEQRHLDAVKVFRANYPLGVDAPEHIRFRI